MVVFFFFFFQAEDGIRDGHVTGVQTCALPIFAYNLPLTIMILTGFYQSLSREIEEAAIMDGCSIHRLFFQITLPMTTPRSEERRVGKESRSRRWAEHEKRKQDDGGRVGICVSM